MEDCNPCPKQNKTAEERAKTRIQSLNLESSAVRLLVEVMLVEAYTEQDKITRHASIEDVNLLYQAIDNDAIDCDTVTSVIMNVKAI